MEKMFGSAMRNVWLCLKASLRGSLDSGGDNQYQRRRCLHLVGREGTGVNHVLVTMKAIKDAEKLLCGMQERIDPPVTLVGSSCYESSNDDSN